MNALIIEIWLKPTCFSFLWYREGIKHSINFPLCLGENRQGIVSAVVGVWMGLSEKIDADEAERARPHGPGQHREPWSHLGQDVRWAVDSLSCLAWRSTHGRVGFFTEKAQTMDDCGGLEALCTDSVLLQFSRILMRTGGGRKDCKVKWQFYGYRFWVNFYL